MLLDQNPIMFTGSVWKMSNSVCRYEGGVQGSQAAVEEALELVGMENFADYDAPGLSGGETKRGSGQGFGSAAEGLLCDEPTANVDNENQEIILKIIERINWDGRVRSSFQPIIFPGTPACRSYPALQAVPCPISPAIIFIV